MSGNPQWNGPIVASDPVTDSDLGGDVEVQAVKILDGTTAGTNRLVVLPDGSITTRSVLDNLADTVADPLLGTGKELIVKLADGTAGGFTRLWITPRGSAAVEGPNALGAAPTGNPVLVAMVPINATPATGTAGVLGALTCDLKGRLIVRQLHPADAFQTVTTVGSSVEAILVGGVANESHDLLSLVACEVSGVATRVDLRQVTGGAIVLSFQLAANGFIQLRWDVSWPFKNQVSASARSWTVQHTAAGASVSYCVQYARTIA